ARANLKDDAAAQSRADELPAGLAARPAEATGDRADRGELVSFLGRLVGYLGGPVADAVNQEDRKLLERKLTDRLEEAEKTIFIDARNAVLSRYVEMSDDSAEARERVTAAKTVEKEKKLAELGADH